MQDITEDKPDKINWRKFLFDIIKVIVGALAGWFGAGSI